MEKDEHYHEIVRRHLDLFIREDGTIKGYSLDEYNLDHINEGKNLFKLWRKTKDSKYKKALDLLYTQLKGQPRTSEEDFGIRRFIRFRCG